MSIEFKVGPPRLATKQIQSNFTYPKDHIMNLDLSGRTAVVCGSTQGLGLASAVELAELGANVVLFARNEASLETVVETLPKKSDAQKHSYLVADFSDPSVVEHQIKDWVGQGNRAEILVNNTGGPPAAPAMQATVEEFRIGFNNHLVNNHILCQALVPGMKESQYGRIINVISTSVKTPIPGLGVSNTTRGAVASWGKTLAGELAPFGITVNNVLPGMTWTSRLESLINGRAKKSGKSTDEVAANMKATIPAGRFGEVQEFGSVVAFIASPAASYVNGINIPVDGGRTQCL